MINTHLIDHVFCRIEPEEYKSRLAAVQTHMRQEGLDALLVYSNPWHMSNVFWLSGYRSFDGVFQDYALLLIPAEGDMTLFCEPNVMPYARDESWIEDIRDGRAQWKQALLDLKAQKKPQKIGIAGHLFFALEFWLPVQEVFGQAAQPTELLARLKCIKSEAEIRLMRAAGRLADQSMRDLQLNIREGMTEREAVQIMHTSLFQNGADSQAFDVMVQSGVNAGRYVAARARDKKIRKGELLLIDTGVRFLNYASDIGRGVAYGAVSPQQDRLLEVALQAWEAGLPYLKPGLPSSLASKAIEQVLAENGFASAHTAAGNRKCGHGLGNDPEEEFPLMGREDHVLQENMALAYELTVQTPELGGCRVEDSIVIRRDGPDFLSNYPRNIHWD